jgi:hypothetical protein
METFPTRVLLFIFLALLAASQLAPLQSNTLIPNQADLLNHIAAIVQAAMEWDVHQFPLRIAPLQHNGWFYPFFQFYAPTSYLYAVWIYKYIVYNPYIAYKFTVWSALFFGGLYIYRLVYWLTKSAPAGLLASTVFLTMPYLNILVGALGAFNEIIAISIIPFILYYTLRDYKEPNALKNLLLVSLGWYVLITTHIITFIFAAGLIGLLLFLLTCQNKRWIPFFRTLIAILFSCALSTWFLAPQLLFGPHFNVVSSFPNVNDIYLTSSTLPSLLSPTLNKIMNMQQNVITRAHQAIGLPTIVAFCAAMYAICMNALVVKRHAYDYYIGPLVIIFLVAFFLLWSPVNVWAWLPKQLLVIQYTMRMLAQLAWIGPLIFAWVLCWMFQYKLDTRHVIIGVLLIFAVTNSLLPTLATSPLSVKDIIKNPAISFNGDAYLINDIKTPEWIQQINNYQLETLISNRKLVLNTPFYVPRTLLQLAKNPELHIKGYMLKPNLVGHLVLQAVIEKQILGTLTLDKSGAIDWHVPLSLSLIQSKKDLLPLELKLNHSHVTIQADQVELAGFLGPNEILDATRLTNLCHHVKAELICETDVSNNIKVMILPMFYYPKLLKVFLNGKMVPYYGVLDNGKIIVGITPQPGTRNVIKASFTGLAWANLASEISWGLWGVVFLWCVLRGRWRGSKK